MPIRRFTQIILIVQSLALVGHDKAIAQPAYHGKYEVRAVWITTVNSLDWPPSHDAARQKESLREMVVKLHEARFNTIFFQVRGRADALYHSRFEPWSDVLTGTLGKHPGWDPLQFIIDEAHARAMEVHAWFNTFYVKSGKGAERESIPRHVTLQHPEWVKINEGQWWIDPGVPAAREYVIDVAMDIVRHYDIDGIEFDFARYPGNQFPDDAVYKRFGAKLAKEDWRRENVNEFIRSFYDSATAMKPLLKVGSTPIGIYRNAGSIKGRPGYDELFQDARRWMREKVHDYISPQVYWSPGDQRADPDFGEVAKDWALNAYGRHVYIGVAAYKPDVNKQIPRIIDISRSLHVEGNCFFRYENIRDVLAVGGRYSHHAIVPPMPWKDSIPSNPPSDLKIANLNDGVFELRWRAPSLAADGDRAGYYNIYRSTQKSIDVGDPANLIAIIPANASYYLDTIRPMSNPNVVYAVTASDRGHNESRPTPEQRVTLPEVAELASQFDFQYYLGTQYPDRASTIVYFRYEIKMASPVTLKIIDQSNDDLITVVDAVQEPGSYIAAADISTLQPGTYVYVLSAATFRERRPLIIGNENER